MSSDGKPLWGFRLLFVLFGLFYAVCSVWTAVELLNPTPRFSELYPPGSGDHMVMIVLVAVLGVLGAASLWLWLQLRAQRFTARNWIIGLVLLLPALLILPLGLLCVICWCVNSCRSLFYRQEVPSRKPTGPADESNRPATGV
jgi:hypothetical protein